MAKESTETMKGTKYQGKELFYHDTLSQLTEKVTVEWMKKQKIGERNIYDMWIKPIFGCNDEIVMNNGSINTNYAGQPDRKSLEFMSLDNTLN